MTTQMTSTDQKAKLMKKCASEQVAGFSGNASEADSSALAARSAQNTTAQTIDDSFEQVVTKGSRRGNKQLAKEKQHEEKVSKKLSSQLK